MERARSCSSTFSWKVFSSTDEDEEEAEDEDEEADELEADEEPERDESRGEEGAIEEESGREEEGVEEEPVAEEGREEDEPLWHPEISNGKTNRRRADLRFIVFLLAFGKTRQKYIFFLKLSKFHEGMDDKQHAIANKATTK